MCGERGVCVCFVFCGGDHRLLGDLLLWRHSDRTPVQTTAGPDRGLFPNHHLRLNTYGGREGAESFIAPPPQGPSESVCVAGGRRQGPHGRGVGLPAFLLVCSPTL